MHVINNISSITKKDLNKVLIERYDLSYFSFKTVYYLKQIKWIEQINVIYNKGSHFFHV